MGVGLYFLILYMLVFSVITVLFVQFPLNSLCLNVCFVLPSFHCIVSVSALWVCFVLAESLEPTTRWDEEDSVGVEVSWSNRRQPALAASDVLWLLRDNRLREERRWRSVPAVVVKLFRQAVAEQPSPGWLLRARGSWVVRFLLFDSRPGCNLSAFEWLFARV